MNSKIDLHRDSRRSEDKQGRGVKWVYGKRGVNGMEGRVLSAEPKPDLCRRRIGSFEPWISILGMDLDCVLEDKRWGGRGVKTKKQKLQ